MTDFIGTSGNDYLVGGDGSDGLHGLSGSDILSGGLGSDYLDGGTGADAMSGGQGDDVYIIDDAGDYAIELAGEGRDVIYSLVSYGLTAGTQVEVLAAFDAAGVGSIDLYGNGLSNELWGNDGVNFLSGAGGADVLFGFGGTDTLLGESGSDYLDGGSGNDGLFGGDGDDVLIGGNGSDYLDGGTGSDGVYGGAGDDFYLFDGGGDFGIEAAGGGRDVAFASVSYVLTVGSEIEVLAARDAASLVALDLYGNELSNELWGSEGSNVLGGGGGLDTLLGFGGADSLLGGAASDYLDGGEGNDGLFGGEDNDLLVGGNGADYLDGGTGADTMYGGAGDDVYLFDSGIDYAVESAGQGLDSAYTNVSYILAAGNEIEILAARDAASTAALDLYGNDFSNQLWGNQGANLLSGGGGNDALLGFAGNDTLIGGAGNDFLDGGQGQDSILFDAAFGAGNVDTIASFSSIDDTIILERLIFAGLASGALSDRAFAIGPTAADADDRIVYNNITGALCYDADGNGASAQVQFAILQGVPALTAGDFFVSGPANHAPTITSGAGATIAENSSASTIVYQTLASDADGDRIAYSLTGADSGLLTIDANGAVRLIASADFEAKATYNFNVVASDSGISTSKAVTLAITDVLDGATPIISETAAANDATGQAQFIDRNAFVIASNNNLPNDSLPSATIQGNVSSDSDRDYFSIMLQQGELLILDVDGTNSGLDSFLEVFGPSGNEIGENDDQGAFDPGSTGIVTTHNTDSYYQFRAPSAGTYYFAIGSFEMGSSGNYRINVSIGPTATPQQILQEDVNALTSGSKWNHTDLTYGFPQIASQYPGSFQEVNPASEFQPFSLLQQAATRSLVQLVANVSTLTFTERTGGVDPTSGAGSANLRYAMTTDPEIGAAYAYYPSNSGPTSLGGSAWFNITTFNNPQRGNYAWMGILHETGHALGLKHGHEAPAVSVDHDSVEYTVMTYRSYVGDPLTGGYSNETFGYPQTLMMLDIAALQRTYGANFAVNATNSVYMWSATTGEMFINGFGQGAPGNGAGGSANRIFMTIWDGGGADTYDLSNYGPAGGVTIDLRPGEWTSTNSSQTANLGNGHFARGNIANALLFNDSTASAIENAKGGAGDDTLIANLVANQLTGNGGADIFKWMAVGDAGAGALADTVLDFERGTDQINFFNLDTDPSPLQHGNYAFIGTNAFHNVAGEVRYDVIGGSAHIFADADGNGTADMEIILTNITVLSGADFTF